MSNDKNPSTYGNILTNTRSDGDGDDPPSPNEYDGFSDWKRREEEDTMSGLPDFEEIFGHVKRGAEMSAVDEGSDLILDLVRDFIGDEETAEMILSNTLSREGVKGVAALAIYYLSDVNPSWMPKPGGIKRVCGDVIENSSRNLLKRVASMTELREKLVGLAKLGERLERGEDIDEDDLPELTGDRSQLDEDDVADAEFEGVDSKTSQREAVEEHGETQRR